MDRILFVLAGTPLRVLDVLLSALRPVRRYRCRSLVCSWQGNLPPPQAGAVQPGRTTC